MTADVRSDILAQHAARLIHDGKAHTVHDAVRQAILETGWTLVGRPSMTLVRRHVQALFMQSIGRQAYEHRIIDLWTVAEQLMGTLEDWDPRLLGRAADGHIDAGVTIYLRIFTSDRIGTVAQWIVSHGYEEPTFATADTPHHGRFDRIRFETDSIPVVITRCAPHQKQLAAVDLFTDRAITAITLDQLRRQIAQQIKKSEAHG